MKYKIYNQDVLEWAKEYSKGKFHALISDPPYHLTSPSSKSGSQPGTESPFGRHNQGNGKRGFMGQTWDGGDVAFRPETWAALGEHLFDGAFGMAFSASRNWHRLAVAIEDAGFIIHPTIFGWLNGQGFPKATNIAKQLDDGKVWEGHRYGLQALKPAVEPIIVFQKPYNGRPIDNITETGAGALNIDAGRIGMDGGGTDCDNRDSDGNCLGHPSANGSLGGGVMRHSKLRVINRFTDGAKPWGNGAGHEYETELTSQGRWPANFLLDEDTAQLLDKQTGILTSGAIKAGQRGGTDWKSGNVSHERKSGRPPQSVSIESNEGGTSRFFYTVSNAIDDADPIYYCGKVSKKERDDGLDELPTREVKTHGEMKVDTSGNSHNTTGQVPARRKNIHPTVKPIDLATYLAKLLLPPDEYAPRRILVPFSGVGSEMIGCFKAGWEQVVGIEFDKENGYVEIAKKRIEHWTNESTK